MNDLASEFFYEGIRRIIPGCVCLIFYWRWEFENIFHAHKDFLNPILYSICFLVIAWLVGFIVECVTYVPFKWIFSKELPCEGWSKLSKCLLHENPQNLTTNEHNDKKGLSQDLSRELRRQGYLNTSIKVMSRCLFCVFLFSCFYTPEKFSNISWNKWLSFIVFFVFFIDWIGHKIDEKKRR